jgi:transposase InsO family protein
VELHGNARLTFRQRVDLVHDLEDGMLVVEAADKYNVSDKTVRKWRDRFEVFGEEGLLDGSSAPHYVHNRIAEDWEETIVDLRKSFRMTSTTIAGMLAVAVSTVCAVLKRNGIGKLSQLEPLEPPNRYCRRHPGSLVHVDTKKLARFNQPGHRVTGDRRKGRNYRVGYDVLHVCIDDASRIAYVEVLPDETARTAAAFFKRAVAWFERYGIKIDEVLSDNGSCYISGDWSIMCSELHIHHIRTRPYRPRTNGKAERFIQTLLREWAYVRVYKTSRKRNGTLVDFLDFYNHDRPHGSLGHRPPISLLAD